MIYITIENVIKEIASNVYQFPTQRFFGEPVHTYAIPQDEVVYCFDLPEDSGQTIDFLRKFGKPLRVIMSHGSTANGFESTRNTLRRHGLDVQIWLHEQDGSNAWLTIVPDILLTGGDQQLSENVTLLFTPGHTKGSVCLFANVDQGMLFTGDTLGGMPDGMIRPFSVKKNDLGPDIFFASLRKLLNYQFQWMYPFHYDPVSDARRRLEEFVDTYAPRKKGGETHDGRSTKADA